MKNYSFGIDVGIGSVGVAVIDNDTGRIEYLGSRIFDSSETKEKNSKCQNRRGTRGIRRTSRRRYHRKERLKHLFAKYDITTQEKLNNWYANGKNVRDKILKLGLENKFTTYDIYPLRAMALDYELSGEELAAVILHICNHRGYRPFYEEEEKNEDEKLMQGRTKVKEIMERDGYRTVGEMYALAPEFKNNNPTHKNFTYVKNSNATGKVREEFYLVERSQIEDEVKSILDAQSKFNNGLLSEIKVLTQGQEKITTIADRIFEIVFAQRDFEDGPSYDETVKGQKYHGFGKNNSGYCSIYKTEKRGIRASLLGDLYATTNLLSQYNYIDKETGEIGIKPDMAKEIVNTFLKNGKLSDKALKEILKKYNFEYHKNNTDSTFSKCNKFCNEIKVLCEKFNIDWNEFIGENPVSTDTKIHRLAEILAYNVTPKRREKALLSTGYFSKEMCKAFGKNYGGTTLVSDKFMIESINAFMNGEVYGDFQARKNEEMAKETEGMEKPKKIPQIEDIDIIKNPVVFRSINETRKVVNAIIEKYGSPSSISVEVATELNQSKESASKANKRRKKNENENDIIKKKIVELTGMDKNSVTKKEIDKYKLYEQQEGKCLYSGEPIILERLFTADYEVDHIIPFSLILDDTLNNKCLVLRRENQSKRQRTPLQYFNEEGMMNRLEEYKARVAVISKKAGRIKLDYLMTPDIYQDIFDQWKSRNINDTRYIAKYVAGMLGRINIKNGGSVITVKGGLTSRFRKWWLVKQKSELDCYKYIEEKMYRISRLEREIEKTENEEAKNTRELDKIRIIEECIEEARKQYGFSEEYTRDLIEHNLLKKSRENNLHHGVDAAIIACLTPKYIQLALDNNKLNQMWYNGEKPDKYYNEFVRNYDNRRGILPQYDEYLDKSIEKMKTYYHMSEYDAKKYLQSADKIPCRISNLKDEILVRTYDRDEELFYGLCAQVYGKDYARTLEMPLVSRKQQRALRGEISDANPLRKEATEGSYHIKDLGLDFNGNPNKTVIPDNKYYCIEIYKNTKGETDTRGIRKSNLTKRNGKLYLNTPYPEDYKEHIMYLFKNDYISITDGKGKLKIEGYYQSVKTIGRGELYFTNRNSAISEVKSIAKKDTVKKYNIDILGHKGSEIKCGGRSLLTLPKE